MLPCGVYKDFNPRTKIILEDCGGCVPDPLIDGAVELETIFKDMEFLSQLLKVEVPALQGVQEF